MFYIRADRRKKAQKQTVMHWNMGTQSSTQAIRNGKWLKGVRRQVDPGFDLFTQWPQHAQGDACACCLHNPSFLQWIPPHFRSKASPFVFCDFFLPSHSSRSKKSLHCWWCQVMHQRGGEIFSSPCCQLLPMRVVIVLVLSWDAHVLLENAVSTLWRERRFPFNV